MTIPACVDCRFYLVAPPTSLLTPARRLCAHPDSQSLDLVIGALVMPPCAQARQHGNCGRNANLFAPSHGPA